MISMCDHGQKCDCEAECECDEESDCCHKGAQLRGAINIAILSVLKRKDAHGSILSQNLKDRFGMDVAKPVIYMALRRMEQNGLLVSHWDIEGSGPAKRVYKITEDGIDYLNESISEMRKMAEIIGRVLDEGNK
jgi:DNA-binding PadR family transcriptional regulator